MLIIAGFILVGLTLADSGGETQPAGLQPQGEQNPPTAVVGPTPTTIPTPDPFPVVPPVATPTAEPTATPMPTLTPTPGPTNTPQPTATATPQPTATATPQPTATAMPQPTATATPVPTPTATPVPTPVPWFDHTFSKEDIEFSFEMPYNFRGGPPGYGVQSEDGVILVDYRTQHFSGQLTADLITLNWVAHGISDGNARKVVAVRDAPFLEGWPTASSSAVQYLYEDERCLMGWMSRKGAYAHYSTRNSAFILRIDVCDEIRYELNQLGLTNEQIRDMILLSAKRVK